MGNWFDASPASLMGVIFTTIGIYFTTIILTKIAGKRSFSKMSGFDFAMTLSIGAIIATTLLSPSVSFLQGIVGLATIYILQAITAILRHFSIFENLVDNSPLLLMDGQKIIQENLRKARITEDDLRSKLREANVLDLSQIKAVVFETTGNISVLRTEGDKKELEDWLLKDVQH